MRGWVAATWTAATKIKVHHWGVLFLGEDDGFRIYRCPPSHLVWWDVCVFSLIFIYNFFGSERKETRVGGGGGKNAEYRGERAKEGAGMTQTHQLFFIIYSFFSLFKKAPFEKIKSKGFFCLSCFLGVVCWGWFISSPNDREQNENGTDWITPFLLQKCERNKQKNIKNEKNVKTKMSKENGENDTKKISGVWNKKKGSKWNRVELLLMHRWRSCDWRRNRKVRGFQFSMTTFYGNRKMGIGKRGLGKRRCKRRGVGDEMRCDYANEEELNEWQKFFYRNEKQFAEKEKGECWKQR